jgi:hypothetical protein
MATVDTIDKLVRSLGGPSDLGQRLGICQSAVSMWSVRGFIPPAWHFRLYIELVRKGLEFDPVVFDLSHEDASPLSKGRATKINHVIAAE